MHQKTGKGLMKFENGDQFEGEYFEDKIEGYGIMNYKAGKILRYEGFWSNGIP